MALSKDRIKILALLSVLSIIVTIGHSAVVSAPAQSANAMGEGITVEISDGHESIEAGGSLVYNIAITTHNAEPYYTDVRFTIPYQIDTVVPSDEGRQQGFVVRWDDIVIHPGVTRNLQVHATVNANSEVGETILADVTVEGVTAGDSTFVAEKNRERPPLKIRINNGLAYAEPEQELHYIITIDNTYGDDRTYTMHTTIPAFLRFHNATGHYRRQNNREYIWDTLSIAAGEIQQFDLYGVVDSEAPNFTNVRLRVAADGAFGADSTTILEEIVPPTSLGVSVNDQLSTAVSGEEITYQITLTNHIEKLITNVDVVNALPRFTEFVSASDGGYWNGQSVSWENLTVSPHGHRILYVTLRVRSDAPLGAVLQDSVKALGVQAVDITEVSDVSRGYTTRVPADKTVRNGNALLRVSADRSDVSAGDSVTYTIYLKNTVGHAIENVQVENRTDGQYITVLDAPGARSENGQLVWNVGRLDPNQEWSTRVTVRVSENTPHGASLQNIVTVRGDGMETLSLTERVRTLAIGVLTDMPNSGAAMDVLFSSFMTIFGAGGTFWTRKKRSLLIS